MAVSTIAYYVVNDVLTNSAWAFKNLEVGNAQPLHTTSEMSIRFFYDFANFCAGQGSNVRIFAQVLVAHEGELGYEARPVPSSRFMTNIKEGKNVPAHFTIALSDIAPPLTPGTYNLKLIASVKCRDQVFRQMIDSDLAEFKVIE